MLVVRVERPKGVAAGALDLRFEIAGDPASLYRARHDGAGFHRFDRVPCESGTIRCAGPTGAIAVTADATEATLALDR